MKRGQGKPTEVNPLLPRKTINPVSWRIPQNDRTHSSLPQKTRFLPCFWQFSGILLGLFGDPVNFLQRGNSLEDLVHAVDVKRAHVLFYGELSNFSGTCSSKNQFANFSIDGHQLINADSALETRLVAMVTPFAPHETGVFQLFLGKATLGQNLVTKVQLFSPSKATLGEV